jgi:hypothetical protein
MKSRYIWLGLALMGCGSENRDDSPQPVEIPVSEQTVTNDDGLEEILANVAEAPPLGYEPDGDNPWLVAEVDIGDVNVKFIEVTIQGDDGRPEKSMMLNTIAPFDQPNPVDELRNSSDVTLTLAEIYLGLMGSSVTVPEALMDYHEREVEFFGRGADMIRAVRVPLDVAPVYPALGSNGRVITDTDKQAQEVLSSKDMNVNGDAAFTPPVLNHKWVAVHIGNRHFCPPEGGVCAENGTIRSHYICTGRTWWDQIVTGTPSSSGSCSLNLPGWVRMATWNFPACIGCNSPYSTQQFFGPSVNGAWSSFAPTVVSGNQIVTYDWNTPQAKRQALAHSRQQKLVHSRMMTGFNRAL